MNELEPDALFIKELRDGHQWQLWVALQLLKAGLAVEVPELQIRPSQDEINGFTDVGDVIVHLPGRRVVLEVKSRSIVFTGVQDYPYPTAFVDRVNTWQRKQCHRPAEVLLVSQQTGAIIGISAKTEDRWMVENRHDNVREYDRAYYMASKGLLYGFAEIVDLLKTSARRNHA